MKKLIIVLFMCVSTFLISNLFAGERPRTEKPLEVYVVPGVSNSGSGTKQDPFTTLEQARDVARNENEHVIVYLRDGTYWLDKTFELDQRDSNVTCKAYPGWR